MKILTLNTWQERGPWKARWELIFRALDQFRPDVAAFQEVFNREWAAEVGRLSGFDHFVFNEQHGGLMFLSRYPVLESACLTMATQSPSEEYKRYALYAKLETESKAVSFLNTHLSWRLNEGEIRERQVEELLNFVKERVSGGPAFVMGDFNAPPDTKEVRRMMLEGGFIDLYGVQNPGDPGLTWCNKNPYAAGSSVPLPDRRIDYIFMQGVSITKIGEVKVILDQPHDEVFASDHFGVLAEIMF
jgi:endonuclease/exonuclease/phosphatase family metal-dependent hydrolase